MSWQVVFLPIIQRQEQRFPCFVMNSFGFKVWNVIVVLPRTGCVALGESLRFAK